MECNWLLKTNKNKISFRDFFDKPSRLPLFEYLYTEDRPPTNLGEKREPPGNL